MEITAPFGDDVIRSILPHREPFLLVDRVEVLEPDRRIVCTKTFREDDYYLRELATLGTLRVSHGATTVRFVKPGETVQLNVLQGSTDVTSDPGTLYHIPIARSFDNSVDVSPTGLVTVLSWDQPIRMTPSLFQVYVVKDGELGIAQFGLVDDDTDGDLLVDSFEAANGRVVVNVAPVDQVLTAGHLRFPQHPGHRS